MEAPIRAARTKTGLTQQQLAERAGTTQSAVARLEAGKRSPSLATLERLFGAMNLRLNLTTEPLDYGIDPTLVATALRVAPAERLRRMASTFRSIERMRKSVQRSLREASSSDSA